MTEERLKFVVLASRQERNISHLCEEFGISRQTGYTWLKRYSEGGASQVVDRSRRPKNSPQRTDLEVEEYVVSLRKRWPDWGAAKLSVLLRQHKPDWPAIAVRTVHRILDRHGLIDPQDRKKPAWRRFERETPNELWQMDFKGPPGFNRVGALVGPLVILDDHSRYLIALKHLGNTQAIGVKETLTEAFKESGVPKAMLMDHGTPWWNNSSPWGLSELSVWIMRQGIRLYYSGIRHPQTQGKSERSNRSLKRAVNKRGGDLTDQKWLDDYRQDYNHIRPHEGLAMATPSTRWHRSSQPFQPNPPDWEYPASMALFRVKTGGQVHWQSRRWEISHALRDQVIGIERIEQRALVYFCNTPLRELNLDTGECLAIPVAVRIAAADYTQSHLDGDPIESEL